MFNHSHTHIHKTKIIKIKHDRYLQSYDICPITKQQLNVSVREVKSRG